MKNNYFFKNLIALTVTVLACSFAPVYAAQAPDPINGAQTGELLISGEPLKAMIGTPLDAKATFKSPIQEANLRWYYGSNKYNMQKLAFDGNATINFSPDLGSSLLTVTAFVDNQTYYTDTLEIVRFVACSETVPGAISMSLPVYSENFGKLATETERTYTNCWLYNYKEEGDIESGDYAVTANPSTCGNYPSFYDHTQGGLKDQMYGGMLLINTRETADLDILYSDNFYSRMEPCDGEVYSLSAWFRNAGTSPISLTIRAYNGMGELGGEVDFTVNPSEGWKRAEVAFPGTMSFSFSIINNSGAGAKIAIDDILVTSCSAAIDLWGFIDEKRVPNDRDIVTVCDGKVKLQADPQNIFEILFYKPCPYYLWQETSEVDENGYPTNWKENEELSANKACPGTVTPRDGQFAEVTAIEDQPMYYRAFVAKSQRDAEAYMANPGQFICPVGLFTPASRVSCKAEIEWPTIITPYEMDDKNDFFAPFKKNTGVPIAQDQIDYIKVFDRTGNEVADIKNDYWYGTKGNDSKSSVLVMPDVYYYVAKLVGDDTIYKSQVEVYQLKATKKK